MRPHLLVAAAAGAILFASQALAASAPMSSSSSDNASTNPSSSSTSGAAPSSSSSPSADVGASANTSATAGGFTIGEAVKDNTGATIGTISDLKSTANGQQTAVIKMGADQFQVTTDKLGSSNGSATINLSQAQITGMLHGGSAAH